MKGIDMVRKLSISCFLLSTIISISAQNLENLILNGGYLETNIHLKNGSIELMSFFDGIPEEVASTYKYEEKNGIGLITIEQSPLLRIALLFNNEFGIATIYTPIVAESIVMQQFVNNSTNYPRNDRHDAYITSYSNYQVTASSYLKESKSKYEPDNLRKSIFDGPWVEGIDGSGIGEYLTFTFNNDSKVNALLISNGYVSFEKPELFIKNNRVKRILIESIDGNFIKEYELLDTATLQTIRLNQYVKKIRITILEVYKGSTWDDTCINMIIGLNL